MSQFQNYLQHCYAYRSIILLHLLSLGFWFASKFGKETCAVHCDGMWLEASAASFYLCSDSYILLLLTEVYILFFSFCEELNKNNIQLNRICHCLRWICLSWNKFYSVIPTVALALIPERSSCLQYAQNRPLHHSRGLGEDDKVFPLKASHFGVSVWI